MIEPMIRYSVLLYHGDVQPFMERLREVGVIDITFRDWEASSEQRERISWADRYAAAYRRLGSFDAKSAQDEEFGTVRAAVEAYEAAAERTAQLENLRAKATTELDELTMWGEFDPEEIKRLREQEGIAIRFFRVPTKQYREIWEREYAIQVVASGLGGETFFVVAQPLSDGDRGAGGANNTLDLGPSAVELRAPEMTFAQKEGQIEKYLQDEAVERGRMVRAALSRDRIWADYLALKDGIMFADAMNAGDEFAEGTVKVIEAWSTVANREKVEAFLEAQDAVIWTSEQAVAEQNPPIKLKNKFFARLYEPIGSLYMLPRYNELDMTPFFAPFFMLFFGMCFGDAGYGLVFILAILLFWRKIPVKFRDFAWLGLFLNIATVFFGMLTGNVFGIELVKIPALVEFKNYFVSNDNMFNVAVGMGVAQVLFGQIIRIFNRSKQNGSFLYGLSTLGWVILMIGGGLVLGGVLAGDGMVFYVLLGIAGLLIFFFNSPRKNPLVNVGVGLYSCYEMATGVVGDLVSYVRLFAIGLAGAIIAQVFNALSVGLSGDIPVLSWIFMVAILAVGHGLNIFISALGAFVHPVRLTFVEFYKNAGFEGGGRRFTPFKRAEK